MPRKYLAILAAISIFFGLYLASLYSYLLFHSIVEIFCVLIAFVIFVIAWNSRQFIDNSYLAFMGIAFLFIGSIDIFHLLSYKGMGVFRGYDANLPTQFWIAGRYVQSLSFFLAPLMLGRKVKINIVLLGYTAVTILLLGSIFYWDIFPNCFIEGTGLTLFKKLSEYIICFILLASLFQLYRKRQEFNPEVLRFLVLSILLTIASELSFTLYTDVYGFFNLIGHFLKVVAFYFVYRALVETGLKRPYSLLFRNLVQREEDLRKAKEGLELKVAERTIELRNANKQLQQELTERRHAEQNAAQLAAIVQSSDDAIIGKTLDGIITSWNRGSEKVYGYLESEVIGRPISILIPPGLEDEAPQILAKIKLGEHIEHFESVRRRKDGHSIDVSLTVSPIRDAAGKIVAASTIGRDITAHKRLENIMEARLRLLEFANTHSLDELLTATLDEIEAQTGSAIGFYHFLEADQKTLSLQNWSTNTLKNMCTAAAKGSHYDVAQAGVWVDCISVRGAVIHSDYASLPHRKGMPEGHAPVVREVVVPIFRGNLIKAIIGVGNKASNYDDSDIEIISQLGDLSWDIVERKLAEEALRESEERFRDLYENAPNAYFSVGIDGLIRRCNRRAGELLGYAVEELVGRPALELYAETAHGKEKATQVLKRFRTMETVRDVELEMKKADGNPVWVSLTVDAVQDAQGRAVESRSMVVDITERKRAEGALRETERKLRTLVDNIPDCIVRFDANCRLLFVNPAVTKTFGVPSENLLGKTMRESRGPGDEAQNQVLESMIKRAFAENVANTLESRWETSDSPRFFDILHVPERDENGKVVSVLGIAHDITERKGAEEALSKGLLELQETAQRLEQSRNMLQLIMESIPVRVFWKDRDLRYLGSNTLFAQDAGFSQPQQLLGEDDFAMSWREQAELYRADDRQVMESGCPKMNIIEPQTTPTGAKIWLKTSKVPLHRPNGEVFGVLGVYEDITERKQAEEALRKSEGRLAQAQRVAHVGYWDRELDIGCVTLSEETCRIFGLPPEKGILNLNQWHKHWVKLIHPEDRLKTSQAAAEALRGGPRYDVEYRVVRPNGEVRFVHSVADVALDELGRPSSLFGVMQDITEYKQAEEALRQTNETLRATLDTAPVAIIDLDTEGRVKSVWNPAAEQMLGWRREEVLGKFLPTVPEESKEEFAAFRVWVSSGKSILGKDVVRQRKDGSPIEYSIYAAPEYDADGQISGNIAVLVDITERKRLEKAVADERHLLFSLLEAMPAYVGLLTPDYQVAFANLYFREQFGEPEGRRCYDYMFGRSEPCENCQAYKVLESKIPEEYEWLGPDGRTYQICDQLVHDTDGSPLILEMGIDITERKRAEEEIRKLNLELEQRVRDRTAQLEAANQELEAFAYSVSHDLRAPLRHVDGFLELLQKRTAAALDEKSQHYLDQVFDSTRRMGTLIDDLLSFSRMGRWEMLKKSVDLKALLQEVIREFEPEMRGRSIHWQIADLPGVIGDYAMLRIVLVNLISNALKFTRPRQQAEIEIGCLPGREKETIIFVRDNGVGFDINYADNLFGVFQRLHRVEEFEGTGIGLANVRRIISRHGGRTWAEGKLDQGATIYFSLP